ncbi:Adenine DNA glycosylase [Tepidimonas thermarum]|uniref:Adenine DNA glycosylase n=1 Tax=Tepidimonas thermarum TaxID=335431 RepID=A0A554X0W2_9BURK|nr:A/G-specific adenine glycosylase [Tepidimonas thermarum]TSE29499.1 Adenine DNA glycosylase [Tepidimonas thermarum]
MTGDAPPTVSAALRTGFFPSVVAWQRRSGRHGLPWQGTRDPYSVWLSEVMLQQTQVRTVLGYYERFLRRFPDVHALAAATLDEVLALWSGLGYYRRARHLHACAQTVVAQHGGRFPTSAAALATLPGIGASTAAAIAAFCFGERCSILDGNVRRVLARVLADDRDPAHPATQRAWWTTAQALIPDDATAAEMAAYTQGLMDLGATVCTRTRPRCDVCPVAALCAGQASGAPTAWPRRSPRGARRREAWCLPLYVRSDGAWWLQRRPDRGIWAGLWAPPVLAQVEVLEDWLCAQPALAAEWWPAFDHTLTHRDLRLQPLLCRVPTDSAAGPAPAAPGVVADQGAWWSPSAALSLGLPAPVRAWLQTLVSGSRTSNSR